MDLRFSIGPAQGEQRGEKTLTPNIGKGRRSEETRGTARKIAGIMAFVGTWEQKKNTEPEHVAVRVSGASRLCRRPPHPWDFIGTMVFVAFGAIIPDVPERP